MAEKAKEVPVPKDVSAIQSNLDKARKARTSTKGMTLEQRKQLLKRAIAMYERRVRVATHRLEGAKIRLESLELRAATNGTFDPNG